MNTDISSEFQYKSVDASIAKELIRHEGTPMAIERFYELKDKFVTDYAYWFMLSTLWVSYTGWSSLDIWKELFGSNRPRRTKSIMKPSELKVYAMLPYFVTIYRAKRLGEVDWIAYTLNLQTAIRFANERGVKEIHEYQVKRTDILALFLRRGEEEVIVLDRGKVKLKRIIDIRYNEEEKE
jgi:hypothetical protein